MQIDLSNLISKNDKIAVALSGGVDSVALLHFLKSKEKELGFSLCAINVEHGIRGKDSLLDSDFCAKLCAKLHNSRLKLHISVSVGRFYYLAYLRNRNNLHLVAYLYCFGRIFLHLKRICCHNIKVLS
jgi:tRNA(Ile)-lysidine synthase TilS/MesJ